MDSPEYARSVFINGPFDATYRDIFDAVIFTVFHCGYIARCARELDDASQTRIDKILRMIKECKFGIHDISRTEPDPAYGLPRFNMPFELGIFLGAKSFGTREQKRKNCLILDRERYRYQIFISDIAGQDICAHGDDSEKVISLVRDWLRKASGRITIPGGSEIKRRYDLFNSELPLMCKRLKLEGVGGWPYAGLVFC